MEIQPLPPELYAFATESAADWQARIARELKGAALPHSAIQYLEGLTLNPVCTQGATPAKPLWQTPIAWQTVRALNAHVLNKEPDALLVAEKEGVDILEWSCNDEADVLLAFANQLVRFAQIRLLGPAAFDLYAKLRPALHESVTISVVPADLSAPELPAAVATIASHNDRLGLRLGAEAANLGALAADQLAVAIAAGKWAVAHLPIPSTDLASRLTVDLVVGRIFLLEIAKLRAFRILWAKYIGADLPTLHTELSTPDLSADNRDANLIRLSAAALSAVAGGAHSVLVPPNNAPVAQFGDADCRRYAVNLQHLLRYESYMDQIADPFAGAYAVEDLTTQLVQTAELHLNDWAATTDLSVLAERLSVRAQQAVAAKAQAVADSKYRTVGVNAYVKA